MYWTLIQIPTSFLVLFDWDCKAGPAVAAVLAQIKMEVEPPSLCGKFVSWVGLKFWSVFELLKDRTLDEAVLCVRVLGESVPSLIKSCIFLNVKQ